MGLWEHGIISQEGYSLELAIHQVLFPHIPTDRADGQPVSLRKKVTNAKCDVFALWGHIYFERDYFITNDKRFMKRTEELKKLGAKGIYTPEQFVKSNVFSSNI
jgi:hypothetical protein